jgi:hypothetical protein
MYVQALHDNTLTESLQEQHALLLKCDTQEIKDQIAGAAKHCREEPKIIR